MQHEPSGSASGKVHGRAPFVLSGRILVLANQKGGVGKTTTAINLGTALAAAGKRVLVIDFDPQGNASTGFGIDRESRRVTSYEVIIGQSRLADAIMPTKVPGLDIVPATVDLSAAEVELLHDPRRNFRLRDAFQSFIKPYDHILVDCPPSLGVLTVNALAAGHAVMVPLQCEFFALEGLSLLLRTIERVRQALNPILQIHGVVLTMYDRRNNLSQQVAKDVRSFLGDRVYETVIPRNVRISEAPSYGKPVLVYDLKCVGSEAYLKLATEVIQRERDLRAN